MREIMDVLLGLLARLQIAHRDDLMRPSGKIDRPQDQFDRGHRVRRTRRKLVSASAGSDRTPVLAQRSLVGKAALEPCTDQIGGRQAGQAAKLS